MVCSFLTLSALVSACLATCSVAATAKNGRALRQADQPTEVDEAASIVTSDPSDIKLVSSMEVLLHSKEQDEDPASPKAQVQRKLVALIWLERVLQQNIDSMDEATYEDKIARNKEKLAKDTSPATASMLGEMRTELHQFAVPFYQKAVQAELERLRERQKVLLNKLIALDAQDGDDTEQPDEPVTAAKLVEEKKKEPTAEEAADKQARRDRSQMFIGIMSGMAGILLCIVVSAACFVKSHVSAM